MTTAAAFCFQGSNLGSRGSSCMREQNAYFGTAVASKANNSQDGTAPPKGKNDYGRKLLLLTFGRKIWAVTKVRCSLARAAGKSWPRGSKNPKWPGVENRVGNLPLRKLMEMLNWIDDFSRCQSHMFFPVLLFSRLELCTVDRSLALLFSLWLRSKLIAETKWRENEESPRLKTAALIGLSRVGNIEVQPLRDRFAQGDKLTFDGFESQVRPLPTLVSDIDGLVAVLFAFSFGWRRRRRPRTRSYTSQEVLTTASFKLRLSIGNL